MTRKVGFAGECHFCGDEDAKYCGLCKKWLCENHRKNYPLRIKGFLNEAYENVEEVIKKLD